MSPSIVSTLFLAAILALCILRPRVGRWFVGLFFVTMGLGVNLSLVLLDPSQFVALGTAEPLVPLYAAFFESVVATAPGLWGLLVVAFQVVVGLLMLGRGPSVRWGLAGAIAFLLAITPLGPWTLANPLLSLGLATLWRRPHDVSLLDAVRRARPARDAAEERPR